LRDLPAVPVALGGPLVVQLADGSTFNVNLAGADQDGDGTLSQTEIARAINQGLGGGLVSAMVVTSGSQTNLVLSASKTGAGSAITLDTSGLPASTLKTALSTGGKQLAARRTP
jgi:flagellar hook-associated protein 2